MMDKSRNPVILRNYVFDDEFGCMLKSFVDAI
jgi:hypothetical protein